MRFTLFLVGGAEEDADFRIFDGRTHEEVGNFQRGRGQPNGNILGAG